MVVFDNNQHGVPEIFAACYEFVWGEGGTSAISPDDGVPSFAPCAAEFDYVITQGMGGRIPFYLEAWSNELWGGGIGHRLELGFDCPGISRSIFFPPAREGNILVAAAPTGGYAQILALWVEDRGGVPTLVCRRSIMPGNSGLERAEAPGSSETPAGEADGPSTLTAAPNPFQGWTAISLQGASTARSVRILDVSGRTVRTLEPSSSRGGTARVLWDGRDARGHPVPAGLYNLLATGRGAAARGSVMVLR